jgi:hypothetical protein
MISRLTTFAALFAVLATASLSFAASAQHPSANAAAAAAAKPVHVVQLERVVVVGKRI